MKLIDKISSSIISAMKEKNVDELESLRAIKSALLLAQTQKGSDGNIQESDEIKILQKLVKQRKESAEIYKKQSRLELANIEINQSRIIERFLPDQISTEDLDKLIIILKENNIKNIKLPVSAPFHCSLMSKATNIMSEELNKLNFINGSNKLISNVTAKEILNTDELKDLLIKQIENRVRWRESIINMINSGVNNFVEIGPGKVLSGLIKRIDKEVKAVSYTHLTLPTKRIV